MRHFEYKISRYPAERFVDLAYFCSPTGQCHLEKVANEQTQVLEETLNDMGADGWELVQLAFGKGGIVAFWKRQMDK